MLLITEYMDGTCDRVCVIVLVYHICDSLRFHSPYTRDVMPPVACFSQALRHAFLYHSHCCCRAEPCRCSSDLYHSAA